MTREQAIAEAKHRQALAPDASWITASRAGEWTVVRIVEREPPNSATSAGGEPSGALEVEQSQFRHLGMGATRRPWLTNR
jgi:hypothetical protein